MLLGYKSREVMLNVQSEVHFHFRKKCFSVTQNDLVVLHADSVLLTGVTFVVSDKGRERVRREETKNVHAKVHGVLKSFAQDDLDVSELDGFREAYYNPYKVDTFIDKETGEPLHEASVIVMTGCRMFYR